MNRILCITLVLLTGGNLFAQTAWLKQRDSLLIVIKTQKADSALALNLLSAGQYYEADKPDSAVYYYEAAGSLCDKLKYNFGKLKYLACMTEILETQAKYEQALQYCLASIELAKKAHQRHALAASYNNTAEIYLDLGNPEKALEYYQASMLLFEKLTSKIDTVNLAYVYGNILGIYTNLEQQDKAYAFGLKAIALSRSGKTGDNELALALGLGNLSNVLIKLKRYDSALLVVTQEYAIAKKYRNKTYEISALSGMNSVYLKTNRYSKIKQNAEEMERLAIDTKDKEGMASAKYYLAAYYFEVKDIAKATTEIQDALKIVTENRIKTAIEKDIHLLLSDIGLATGNKEMFHRHREISDSLRDSYVSDKILKYNQQLEAEYSLSKKQSEIDGLTKEKKIQQLTLKQRETVNWILAGIIAAIILLGMLSYRNYRQKSKLMLAKDALKQQRIIELEKEKQLLATLSMLHGQEEERKRIAKDLHDGLGGILSSTKYSFSNMKNNLIITERDAIAFEKSMAMLDQSISELRRVAHNMMPEALLKFGLDTALRDFCDTVDQSGAVKLTYQSFEIDDTTIPQEKASVIYRIIQELVNNILKHAEARTALVQLIRKEDTLSITVEDDGKGFDISVLSVSDGIGYGNLKNRVTYLNGTFDVHTSLGKGTSLTIEIPVVTQ